MTRWPGFVYSEGDEPDYRFSFANERTFLAWIRTSLAMLAAGVALGIVDLGIEGAVQDTAAVVLVLLALVCAVLAWVRWALSERAMRRGEALPSFGLAAVVTLGLVGICVVGIVVLVSR